MSDLPSTRPSLLVRLRDLCDKDAWRQFVQMYAPVVYAYARKRGLQDADAADLTQDVLRAVTVASGRFVYDPGQGSFRGWLFTLTHHKLHDLLVRQRRQTPGSGDRAVQEQLEQLPTRPEYSALWEDEYEQRLFAWAAEQVRGRFEETTWQAFWLTAVEGRSGKEVAERLNLTVAAVYLAKSRVMARLREQVRQFEES
jgi:RNA polymerase sigma-70 factor (ECF subfamily)